MADRVYSAVEKITQENYATSTSPATKTLPIKCSLVLIRNTDATDSILVSLDGTTYFTIPAGQFLSLDVDFQGSTTTGTGKTYLVKSSANTPTANCIYGSEN